MSSANQMLKSIAAALAVSLIGCAQDQPTPGAPAASSKPAAPAASAAPPAPSAPAPVAIASAAGPKPSHPCPDGSTGEGTFKSPCEGKGTARLMDVTWTGKITDAGPSFRVTNKAKLDVLYGNIAVYFYDKAGKQLELKDAAAKPRPKQLCGGANLFAGVMKAGEKAVLNFSCVKKEHVPEGTAAIEGELQMIGFTDASGTKSDTYWRNNDLSPDVRPKGGIK
jgi:hypothetical protein